MKKTESIEFGFENLDWVRIPAEHIRRIAIDDLSGENTPGSPEAGTAEIEVLSSAEEDSSSFPGDWRQRPVWNTLIQRFKQRDITSLTLIYTDNGTERYRAVWNEDPDNENINLDQLITEADGGSYTVKFRVRAES